MKWGFRHALVAAVVALSCVFGFVSIGSAATDAKPLSLTKYTKHHGHKKVARRHAHRPKVAKASSSKSADRNDNGKDESVAQQAALSPRVADARAELSAGDVTPKPDASTLTEADKTAGPAAPGGVEIAASDQLNDIDRDAATQPVANAPSANPVQSSPSPIQATPVMNSVPVEQLSAPAPSQSASRSHSDAWDGASLIGKVFLGFGLMLTLASAARLMIA